MENSPNRVLIIDTAWLGDVIFTTSLIGVVKNVWPQCELHLLVAPRGASIVQGYPQIDRLWIFDKHGKDSSYLAMRRFAKQLRQESFDVVLNAHPSFRSRWLSRLIGAPVSVGYEGFLAKSCFTQVIPNDLGREPDHVLRRIALLEALQGPLSPAPLQVPVKPVQAAWADQFLADNKAFNIPLLGLVPGSAWETKRWPVEHFKALAQKWISERGGKVILFGGNAERDLIADICETNTRQTIGMVNQPIPQVAALLARCESVVGNDTGISLLAVAVGGPRVTILYGCTQINYQLPAPHSSLAAGVPCCLPRTGHGAHQCRWSVQPWCMQQISVDRVWEVMGSAS
jgi:heptosyltransferase-2